MATNIISTGTTATDSSDTTFTTDTLVSLKDAVPGAQVNISAKDDAAAYQRVGVLTQDKPSGILPAGTYRFSRLAGASCGVFSA